MYVTDAQLGAAPTMFRRLQARVAELRRASPAVVSPPRVLVPRWMNLPASIVRPGVTVIPRVAVPSRPALLPPRTWTNLPLPGAPRTPTAPAVVMPAVGPAAELEPAPTLTELEPEGGAGGGAAEPAPAPAAPVEPAAAKAARQAGVAGGMPVGLLIVIGLGLAFAASASGRGRR